MSAQMHPLLVARLTFGDLRHLRCDKDGIRPTEQCRISRVVLGLVETLQRISVLLEMVRQVPERWLIAVERLEQDFQNDRSYGSTGKHLMGALKSHQFPSLNVHLQDVEQIYAPRPTEGVDGDGLDAL